jgi:hypothetical protein
MDERLTASLLMSLIAPVLNKKVSAPKPGLYDGLDLPSD